MARRLLLDTSSLMYRAFFGLPTAIADPAGAPVNAVHGYLDMTTRLRLARKPDQIVHVLDAAIVPRERAEAYPGYKAHRPPDPEGLPAQFDLLAEVLDALGAERAEAPGWEADDAIAALCAAADPADEVEVVTGDRDLMQLVRDAAPTVRILFTVKGVSDLAAYDEAAVQAKYGVPPHRYVEFAILRGDPSDGLPGVAGVGEKTASRLVAAYPTLEALLADAAALPPRLRERLAAARPYLAAMQRVVPVRPDVAVELVQGARDERRLAELGEARRLGGPIRRYLEALAAPGPATS